MPVTLEMPDKRVMRLALTAPWEVKQLVGVYSQEQEYYDATTEKILAIVDLTHMGAIPPGALRARVSPMVTHPNSGQVCVVGANSIARTTAEMVFKLTHFNRIMFFKTDEEAWAYLRPLLGIEDQVLQK